MSQNNNVLHIRPAARRSDPITSKIADDEITLDGTKERQLNQVYQAVRQYRNYTSRELAVLAGLGRYMVARRLSEHPQIKHCSEDHKRKCMHSGRLALTWELI